MLSHTIFNNIKASVRSAGSSRNIGIMAPCLQKASDPIQQLFVDKIREYKQKSGGGNKLVDPTPEMQKELKTELDKVAKQHGGGEGIDMTKFPAFNFVDPKIDPIAMETK